LRNAPDARRASELLKPANEPPRIYLVTTRRRSLIVLGSLVGLLTATSALLLALAPAPLAPEASGSLFAIDVPQSIDAIFQTAAPTQTNRWKYIYVHESGTADGDAVSLGRGAAGVGDHFVIGNGNGAVDGEIQLSQRWDAQAAAVSPPGAAGIDPDCISICLVGDFDHAPPSEIQMKRLCQLTAALQSRLEIPARNVLILPIRASALGVGRSFPTASFRRQLLP
jgi:hypothetical protein